jgi:hypothetical protein
MLHKARKADFYHRFCGLVEDIFAVWWHCKMTECAKPYYCAICAVIGQICDSGLLWTNHRAAKRKRVDTKSSRNLLGAFRSMAVDKKGFLPVVWRR